MTSNADNDNQEIPQRPQSDREARRALSPAARRALAEAEERRRNGASPELPAEIGGRGGADPARFGDWEINGRAIDF